MQSGETPWREVRRTPRWKRVFQIMADQSKKSWRSWRPEWLTEWQRRHRLRQEIRSLAEHFLPLADAARGIDEQRIAAEWQSESQWPEHGLAELEMRRLRKLAMRWKVDMPPISDPASYVWSDPQTGHSYLQPEAHVKLRRAIRDAKRETIRFSVQVIVMPLIGLIGAAIGLVSVLRRK
jgi:hypothetical protein